jgi:hypothetical protein
LAPTSAQKKPAKPAPTSTNNNRTNSANKTTGIIGNFCAVMSPRSYNHVPSDDSKSNGSPSDNSRTSGGSGESHTSDQFVGESDFRTAGSS